uniref:Rubredoxin-like domain-containing protein n=1 Tax=Corethron hystrix TaxID=216773 RepID=A0A7S1BUB6_9STRA|mmetsp:Transcript_39769/g.93142  ORF Transcript_39769/g.93142 Transcript_39769/m.93142 type:complete len:357 (+) Transcript_39769:680-1750(+)
MEKYLILCVATCSTISLCFRFPSFDANKKLNAVGQSLPWVVTGIPVFFLARRMNRKKVLKQNEAIRDFAVEMAYHDGNERELVLCLKEYKKKLPRGRRNDMIDNYLAEYFKVKTVSLNTITNLASVFTLLKLDEVSAAKRLVAAGELLKSKPSSRSKCLFFGDRILKSPEALDALKPLRDMLASNYRRGGAEIVRVSQETMAEAAYKSIVAAAGPDQTSATPGYNILGISKDRAQEIFDEVASENFETTLQQQQRMMESSKEELVTKKDDPKSEGGGGDEVDVMKQVLEENSAEDLEKSKEKKAPAELSIYECETCGYTLFPSSGRDFKFFPDDFVCPECQAPKDKFVQKKQNIDS